MVGSLISWLVTERPPFNLERMLHRGKYAIRGEHEHDVKLPAVGLRALLPNQEYTRFDEFIHWLPSVFILGWVILLIVTATVHYTCGTTDGFWLGYWGFVAIFTIVAGVATTIWLSVGGIFDLKHMFKMLNAKALDRQDDGRVQLQETETGPENT